MSNISELEKGALLLDGKGDSDTTLGKASTVNKGTTSSNIVIRFIQNNKAYTYPLIIIYLILLLIKPKYIRNPDTDKFSFSRYLKFGIIVFICYVILYLTYQLGKYHGSKSK
jgi:hypothetical protein